MATSDPRLLQARQLHQAGRLAEAEPLYRAVLAMNPRNIEALRLYAVLLGQAGRPGDAVARMREAATLAPRDAEVQADLADALMGDRRPAEAAEAFAAAVRARPAFAEAHAGLGVAMAMQGRLEEAAAAFRQATALRPSDAGSWSNLGKALQALGRLEESAAATGRAVALKPDFAAAQFNLSIVLGKLGRLKEAEAACRKAVALRPGWPEALSQLSHLLLEDWRLEESIAASRAALRGQPNLALAQNNLGVALFQTGALEEAETALRRAVALDPEAPNFHHSLAFLLLKQGRMEEGWREYEWRWKQERPTEGPNASPAPRWSGEPIAGRTLLVEPEQGVGDTIQFVRFAAGAAARGARVVLRSPPGLAALLSTAPGAAEVVSTEAPAPPADLRCSVISLPAQLGTRLETIPADVPYLAAPPDRVARWAARLGEGLRIGLVWQGNKLARVDRPRSIPLAAFEPLAAVEGARLISLQKGFGLEQLETLPPGFAVETLGPDYDAGDWSDTAAILERLDLVISCDTGVAHLAGALGRPVWLALPFVSEWRWLIGRDDSPWYPTMRLFRQPAPGDWRGAFAAMAAELRDRPPARAGAKGVATALEPG